MTKHGLLFLLSALPVLAQAQTRFDDTSLTQLLTKQSDGLIFSWSPYMPLSVTGLDEIEEIAAELQLPLQVVLDPYATPGQDDALLASATLVKAGMLNHFPSLVLYRNHRLLNRLIQGYEEKENLKQWIQKNLAQ